MKKTLLIGLIFCVSLSFGKTYKKSESVSAKYESEFIMDDPSNDHVVINGSPTPIAVHTSRDYTFESVLIDSSTNGYGMYSNNTNPLVWVPESGLLAVYRQWAGIDGPSGQLGAAQSVDGSAGSWQVGVGLNYVYPGGATPANPMARYPSAVGTATSNPTPIWNEYTEDGSGGGTNGGRAMYTYDEFGWLGGSYYSPIYDLNTGCQTLPCDPPDLWVSQAQMVDNGSYPVLLAMFGEGLGPDRYWLLRNDYYLFGYLGMAAPYLALDLLNDGLTSGYTGTPEFHVNNNGIGYMVSSSYASDYNTGGSVTHHTLYYKKTDDYGATWESTFSVIADDVLDQALYDSGMLGDSLWELDANNDTVWTELNEAFVGYDYDVKVDDAGGLRILATVVATYTGGDGVYTSVEGCGHYLFYNATPDDPATWTATLVRDMAQSFFFDYTDFSGWQYMYPDMAMSPDGNTIWAVTSVADDTANGTYQDIDIFASRSLDGGVTWEDIGNLTNTASTVTVKNYEMSPHFAPYATAEDAYFIFQMGDWSVNTVGGILFEDYKQRLYVGHLMDDAVGVEKSLMLPGSFELTQNYPNPFNPKAMVEYSIESDGHVSVDLFDLRGSKVMTLVNENKPAGTHDFSINGESLPSGVYFYTMNFAGKSATKKLVLMK
ncbi:MAG: T9SS type A sorting domain-containing protein [Candidatus Marinimicrobia bacterium]|nr:T9SS type A sorting domain-containing protein [Candidatus Neomarinimicrobiota bacterium]